MPIENDTDDQGSPSADTATPEIETEESADSQGSDEEQLDAAEAEQDESQDPDADESDEEDTEETPELGIKDAKSGNFDWKKINAKLGNGELEKSFKESQRQISKVSQENKSLRDQVQASSGLKEKADLFDWFDGIVKSNPALRTQIQAIVAGTQQGMETPNAVPALPEGVNPNDPLAPMVLKQQEMLQRLVEQSQQAERLQKQSQYKERFRQGLLGAKNSFKARTGQDMTEQQLRMVAEEMQSTGVLNGEKLVPALFLDEIEKSIRSKFFASRKEKKAIPKNPKSGGTEGKTAKSQNWRQEMDALWAEHMERD